MPFDKKTQEVAEAITNGTLASQLKKNMKFTTTGMVLGAVIGIGIATFTGKCRLCFGFWGAIGGGAIGYFSAPKKKESEEKQLNCVC
jgi:uncharacterized protein YcfJ